MFSLVPICFCLTLNFVHASSLFLKCSTRLLSAALGDSLLAFQRVLHNQIEGVSCTLHQCPPMLFMQNLHCCYNISTIVMDDGNPFRNICSCVSLFQGPRWQAVGHHFQILQIVARHSHISLCCKDISWECHIVSLLQGFPSSLLWCLHTFCPAALWSS